MTKNDPRPLVPYLRQSRAKERTISIDEQRRDIRRWANEAKVPLAAEVVEQNVSGSKPWRERALGEAVAACERGETAGIVVAWQGRLSRENQRATAKVWEALDKADARLVCAAEGWTRRSRYVSGERGWIKTKNRDYWRYEMEREGALRSRRKRQFV